MNGKDWHSFWLLLLWCLWRSERALSWKHKWSHISSSALWCFTNIYTPTSHSAAGLKWLLVQHLIWWSGLCIWEILVLFAVNFLLAVLFAVTLLFFQWYSLLISYSRLSGHRYFFFLLCVVLILFFLWYSLLITFSVVVDTLSFSDIRH